MSAKGINVEKINVTIPPDLARWAREEAARRTLKANGASVKVSAIVVEALALLRSKGESK